MTNSIKASTFVGSEGVPDAVCFDAFYFLDPHDGLFGAAPPPDFFQTQGVENLSSVQASTDQFEFNGLQDSAWHFSIDDEASISTAATIVSLDGGSMANDVSAADAAGSLALEPASDVFASLTFPTGEPRGAADVDASGSSDGHSWSPWQPGIDSFQLADNGLGVDDKQTHNDSFTVVSILSPVAGPSTEANSLAEVTNPPRTLPEVLISDVGDSANFGQGPVKSIGAFSTPGVGGLEFVVDGVGPVGHPELSQAEGFSTGSASSGFNITNSATNADGTITETVTFAGSGIVFDNTFDASVTQAYENCILAAEQNLASECTNSVTINEEFTAQAEGKNGDLASNDFYVFGFSYATLKGALTTLASHDPSNSYLQQAVAHLPSADPSGGAGFELALPYARMLGLTSVSENPDDIVTLNTSYNWSYGQDVINTVEHEISEGGMGRIGGLGDQNSFWSVMDLFRYNSSGVPDYSDGRDGRTTYFSFNGGSTLSSLSFNNEYSGSTKVNGNDTADFAQLDVFGTGSPGETNSLSQTDIQIMEALGWSPPPQGPVVTVSNVTLSAGQASVTASSLFTASDPNGHSITTYGFMDNGPGHFVFNGVTEPNNQEIDVTAAQLSQLIYQSALGTIDTLQIRAEDSNAWGTWESFSVTAPPLVIEAYGSTSLTEISNHFYLYSSGGSGPSLKYGGADFVAAQFGAWMAIGAEATTSGYEVAWHNTSTDQYTIWNTDSNGNYTSNMIGAVSGTSTALESLEPSFQQDLNGDGHIGLPGATVIELYGSTSLTEIGNDFYLYNSSSSGPSLKYSGADFVAGQFGAWTPIGAEPTASGYEVAWHNTSTDQYTIWNTDSNGNYTSNMIGAVSGTSTALESLEPSFQQDLNGDGHIGLPGATVIEFVWLDQPDRDRERFLPLQQQFVGPLA